MDTVHKASWFLLALISLSQAYPFQEPNPNYNQPLPYLPPGEGKDSYLPPDYLPPVQASVVQSSPDGRSSASAGALGQFVSVSADTETVDCCHSAAEVAQPGGGVLQRQGTDIPVDLPSSEEEEAEGYDYPKPVKSFNLPSDQLAVQPLARTVEEQLPAEGDVATFTTTEEAATETPTETPGDHNLVPDAEKQKRAVRAKRVSPPGPRPQPRPQVYPPRQTYPQVSPPRQTYPQVSPPRQTYPQVSPPRQTYPQVSPPRAAVQPYRFRRSPNSPLKVDPTKPQISPPKVDPTKPQISPPKVDPTKPQISPPKVDPTKPQISPPKVDPTKPQISPPKVDPTKPQVSPPKVGK